jgi:hypothetical protein
MARRRTKKQSGGYLTGPSHEQGGIAANVGGNEMIELEGGEYIVNAQTVNAVGTQFLDKLNSTQTSYHQGGFGSGQLPGSNYRKGGKVRKKLQQGGNTRQCIKHRMPNGTIMEGPTHGAGQTCVEWSNGRSKMRRGGRPVRRMQYGGMAGATTSGGPTTQAGKRRHRRRRKVRPPKHGSRMGGRVARRSPIRGMGYGYQRGGSINGRNGNIIKMGNKQFRCPGGGMTVTADCVEIYKPNLQG